MPDCFSDGSWGRSTRTAATSAELPPGATGRSWRIQVSDYIDGDAKLMPSDAPGCAAAVDASRSYTLGIWYRATTPVNSIPLFRHVVGQGWTYWTTLATLPSVADWTRVERTLPALPAGTTRVSFGVAGEGDGVLLQTGWSLREAAGTGTPPVVTEPDPATGLAATGRWTVLAAPMPLRSVHATLLRDGRVLLIAGSGNDPDAFTAGSFRTSVWDPATGGFTDVPTPTDMFCAGHVTLPDGRVLIAGGTLSYPGVQGETSYRGAKATYVFDPATNRYSPLNETIEGHWYPTLTKLENGDVWSVGGYDEANGSANSTEMFDLSAGRWLAESELPQTYEYWGAYPHMFLLADGRLFYSGGHTFGGPRPGSGAVLHDWRTKGIADIPGLRSPELRDQAGTVLLPPAQDQTFMIAGGGYTDQNRTPTNLVDIVDLNAATPAYRPGPDLPGPGRQYLNLTTLPDRTVLASNGSTQTRGGDVAAAALYDVRTQAWTSVPADPVGRNYHSAALLLPDGRVFVFGSNPADGSFELRVSVYEPPYLFKGSRPTITSAPASATYGQAFDLGVTGTVASAALTSVGSATHQTDTNVRLVDLPVTGTGATLRATVPQNPALLPPGPYLLTVLDSRGVPSVAKTVQIR
ncbi:MAG: galactose oxidase early set domain-containing protein [Actinomycetota bacterium]|nr:galactose oxidase early set domain-containing protein [Actinomycetota bacterium]